MMKRFQNTRYFAIWERLSSDDRLILIVLGAIVGMCSGLAALALNWSLIAMFDWLHPYRENIWAIILPGIGAALSSLFLRYVMKETAGHGVPEVIYTVSRQGGMLQSQYSYSRLISSCLTIGSGGSAGPEAPVVMSGSAIGSSIARFLSLNERQRITLVGCGAAGAISSIFNAPIAGMVFTIEVILGEWTAVTIVPIAIASVAGTEISRILKGNQIPFSHRLSHIDLTDIFASIGLAIFTAVISIILTRTLRFMHTTSKKINIPVWSRAFIGGCMVGGMGYFLPVVLGEGYHYIQLMIEDNFSKGLMIATVSLFAKILATSFTLGWGGSGGIFAPSLVIGSLSGITYHRLLVFLLPTVSWINEGCYALIGMAGLISGMLQAPLTGIFLIVEISGGYEAILPLIIVSAISTTVSYYIEPASFYLKDLIEKGQLLRPGTDARVLSDIHIAELIETDCIHVKSDMTLLELIPIIKKSHRNYFPVLDPKTEEFIGMIHLDDIRQYLFDPVLYQAIVLEQITNTDVKRVSPDDDLNQVLQIMDRHQLYSIPVVSNKKFIGMISKATILDKYRKELIVQTTA